MIYLNFKLDIDINKKNIEIINNFFKKHSALILIGLKFNKDYEFHCKNIKKNKEYKKNKGEVLFKDGDVYTNIENYRNIIDLLSMYEIYCKIPLKKLNKIHDLHFDLICGSVSMVYKLSLKYKIDEVKIIVINEIEKGDIDIPKRRSSDLQITDNDERPPSRGLSFSFD